MYWENQPVVGDKKNGGEGVESTGGRGFPVRDFHLVEEDSPIPLVAKTLIIEAI